jgi:1-pyrroline-5-carboxylate dehydrogenase
MTSSSFIVEKPVNEIELKYNNNSNERKKVQQIIEEFLSEPIEIPIIIGDEEIFTNNTVNITIPHNHKQLLAKAHLADKNILKKAVKVALSAKETFSELAPEHRSSYIMKAGDLLQGSWRPTIIAATMLGISKTVHQAEIDVAELIDMYRFNPYYLSEILAEQPSQAEGMYNRLDYRPLDGFILAISPFNFTSIAGNLPTAPTLMGNTVLWKPATSSLFNAYHLMKLLQVSGLPVGVINFLPSRGTDIGRAVVTHPDLGAIHFTGSTQTMNYLWKKVADNIEYYNQYPRIVGETGGKNFFFMHNSANLRAVVTALIRGSFEYQGQKCSATSRAYVPESLWPQIKELMIMELSSVTTGDPAKFHDFMSAIINGSQYRRVVEFIEYGKKYNDLVYGGEYDDSVGYFINPTIFKTTEPKDRLMIEEIFGPVLTIYVYQDKNYIETLKICDETSSYGLTGSIFASDREAIIQAEKILRFAAGNFYINDKTTGSVVSQQPFGGSRKSGTNDKTAYKTNLLRWTSLRAIKETFIPPENYKRPFMK